jgi:hypothetical protein
MDNSYNFITLGFNCSSALVLKDLGLRKYSLPFDWVVTNNMQVINCLEDDFKRFHKILKPILDSHWLEDEYGIQYPHDYPTNTDDTIVDNWEDYKADVIKKYERRIHRFKTILNDPTPIIALYLGTLNYVRVIKKYLESKYNKTIIFVLATYEPLKNNIDNNIIICNVYNNEDSRNKDFWIDGINKAINKVKNNNNLQKRANKITMNYI